ncbi:hypothetical protein Asi03nite_51040 [Actinoplanes siamensis]|uniref:Uncharacterized protein n=1 Tax=Actinoplanes siamensis TaxID=1223317 RepID=A0A919TLT1_9ACTN|nr:hypothetical protein Asi03nite_51040 [Actinoplanes siamensis]
MDAAEQATRQSDARQQPVGRGMQPQRAGTGVGVRLTEVSHGPDTTGGLRQDRMLGSAASQLRQRRHTVRQRRHNAGGAIAIRPRPPVQ